MLTSILVLVVILAVLGLIMIQVPYFIWLITMLVSIGTVQYAGNTIPNSLWYSIIAFAFVTGLSVIRRNIIAKPILIWFKKVLPPMSQTEREAIEAGDTWWEAKLFKGKPVWSTLKNYPFPELTNSEKHFLDTSVEKLCNLIDDWEVTYERQDLPPKVWDYLKSEGFFGLIIPKEYGGLGFTSLANSTIVQKIATRSFSAAVTVMVPNSLGPAELLLKYGTDEQKQKLLPELASGKQLPCFALTGVDAGSDATGITDTGVICYGIYNRKKQIGIKLNWNKRYITLAPVATLLGLVVKLSDPDQLLSKTKDLGMTLCLIPTNLKGIEIGNRHMPLNQAFLNGPTRGKDVFVPLDHIIGGSEMIGKGWKMLVESLADGRGISLPAISTASGKLSCRMSGAYAKLRQQFNLPIGEFEGVATNLARIGGLTYILESARLFTLIPIDSGLKPSVVTAIAKYHMTEMGRQAINDAMDIHGGRAIMMGKRNYIARAYQGIPISITVEGANILTRSLMIFGQGAIRCHPYLWDEISAAESADTKQGLINFDKAFFAHIYFIITNFTKLKFHTITNGMFLPQWEKRKFSKYTKHITKMSIALSCVSEVALVIMGGSLKRKEKQSARLGDILSHLYMASAVIKYHLHTEDSDINDIFAKWSLDYCLHNAQEAMLDFLDNFPIKSIAFLMKKIIFPLGRKFDYPKDNIELKMSKEIMSRSDFINQITMYSHLPTSDTDAIGRIENAWQKLTDAEPGLAKIKRSVAEGHIPKKANMELKVRMALEENIISNSEAEIIRAYDKARYDAMQVDEFDKENFN